AQSPPLPTWVLAWVA
ncbi:potassium uptake, TrkH family protein, partial [Vibrio parahaemolyticus V-223/04]